MIGTPEIVNGSIACIGAFAPAAFTPDWLLKNNLIGEDEYQSMLESDKVICSASVAQLESNTFICQITPTRIHIVSKDVVRPTINDLAMGILSLLGRVAITSVGINFMTHFKMPSDEAYHRVGDVLVPKPVWLGLFNQPEWSAGLTDLAVKIRFAPRETPDEDDDGHGITIRVQPSAKVVKGILLTFNHHMDFAITKDSPHSDEAALKFLEENWEKDCRDSAATFEKLLSATQVQP